MVSGHWKESWAEASHGLVVSINLDAHWKYAIERVKEVRQQTIILDTIDGDKELKISRDRQGEFCWIENTCPLGVAFRHKPSRHKVRPFKDNKTEAPGLPLLPPKEPSP